MNKRYIVKFIHCDSIRPKIEKYYYWHRKEAEYGNLATVTDEIKFH